MIQLRGINKTYFNGAPLHVLKGIDLDIEKGEMVSIMGASGSGKSTLLNILGILDTYDTGTYQLNGQLIQNLSESRAAELRNRMIGFIFQSFNLISFKNAMENVALPLYYQGVSRKKRNAMALEYLDMVGLKDWAEHMPNEMSGGGGKRVAQWHHVQLQEYVYQPGRGMDTLYHQALERYAIQPQHQFQGRGPRRLEERLQGGGSLLGYDLPQ